MWGFDSPNTTNYYSQLKGCTLPIKWVCIMDTRTMTAYRVRFVATNGDVCQHDYLRWLDAYERIRSFRTIYECHGYVCADDEETWIRGWKRKHVFTKAGHPDLFIEYYPVTIK